MRRALGALPVLLLAVACGRPESIPPEPSPPARETFVSATFDLTWTAALDRLATAGISIADRDAAAGMIETDRITLDPSEAVEYVDCGARGTEAASEPYLAGGGIGLVQVEDDGSWSTVLVTASWDAGDPAAPFPCETTGVWEAELQEAIRLAAEANR